MHSSILSPQPSAMQQWLEANTFYCNNLKARITLSQCQINRTRPRRVSGDFNSRNKEAFVLRPTSCEGCIDWKSFEKATGQVAKKMKPSKEEAL